MLAQQIHVQVAEQAEMEALCGLNITDFASPGLTGHHHCRESYLPAAETNVELLTKCHSSGEQLVPCGRLVILELFHHGRANNLELLLK